MSDDFLHVSRREFGGLSLAAIAAMGGLPAWAQTLPPAKLGAEDKMDIFDLFARYAWAFDCNDAAEYAETFTPDGMMSNGRTGEKHFGRPAIQAFVRGFIDRFGPDRRQHFNDHLVFTGSGDVVTVYSYFSVLYQKPNEPRPQLANIGYYLSDCVRQDGVWLFKQRVSYPWLMGEGLPWKA